MNPARILTTATFLGLALALALPLPLPTQEPARQAQKAPTRAPDRFIVGKVLDANGEPAAGATVRLVSRAYPGLPGFVCATLPHRGPRLQTTAKTDDKGRFRIHQVSRHLICIYAESAAGGTRWMSRLVAPVAAGDYQILRLRKVALLRGVVRDTVKGMPIQGATVHARIQADISRANAERFGFELYVRRNTDAKGRYSVPAPAGSTLIVSAAWQGRHLNNQPAQAGTALDLKFDAGLVIEGFVRDPDGKPIQGALVQDVYQLGATTRTDAGGRFRVVTNQRRYWIHVVTGDFGHAIVHALSVGPGNPGVVWRKDGKLGVQKTLELQFKKKGAHLRARVLDRGGKPRADALVVLSGIPGRISDYSNLPRTMAWETRLDDKGVLDVKCMDPNQASYAFVEVDGVLQPLFGGRLGHNTNLGDVMLPRAGRLIGRVQMSNRSPAAHARVLLHRQPDKPPVSSRDRWNQLPYLEALTDRGGRFEYLDLQPGTYHVLVDVRGRYPYLTEARVTARTDPLQLRMPAGKSIGGQITDVEDAPVSAAPVQIYHKTYKLGHLYRQFGFPFFTTTSDAKGRFAIHGVPANDLFGVVCHLIRAGTDTISNRILDVAPGKSGLELMFTVKVPTTPEQKR